MKRAAKILIPLILIMMLLLSACGSSLQDQIIGTWEDSTIGAEWIFDDDGTMTVSLVGEVVLEASYEIDGDEMTLELDGETETYTITIDGDEMTMESDEETLELVRVD